MGTFYAAEDEAHAFAIAVCDKLRGSVMGCDEFKAECQVLFSLLLFCVGEISVDIFFLLAVGTADVVVD